MPIKKILVPTDFSTFADIALDHALELASALDAHITLLHAYELPVATGFEGGSYLTTETLNLIEASARKALAVARTEALRRWKGPADAIDIELAIGTPYLRIVEEARRGHYDLIVMGTHGRTGLRHLLIGSVAERVVRSADCPVVTVRGTLGAGLSHEAGGASAAKTTRTDVSNANLAHSAAK